MQENTCCFIGHRNINETKELKNELRKAVLELIAKNNIDTFLFGSKSQFNELCYKIVSELKEKYPYIKRIYVRAEYPEINEEYKNYLLERYEHTYYPERILNSGKAVYVERNCEMIDKSRFCIIYYNESKVTFGRKSGTKKAYLYALKEKKNITLYKQVKFLTQIILKCIMKM